MFNFVAKQLYRNTKIQNKNVHYLKYCTHNNELNWNKKHYIFMSIILYLAQNIISWYFTGSMISCLIDQRPKHTVLNNHCQASFLDISVQTPKSLQPRSKNLVKRLLRIVELLITANRDSIYERIFIKHIWMLMDWCPHTFGCIVSIFRKQTEIQECKHMSYNLENMSWASWAHINKWKQTAVIFLEIADMPYLVMYSVYWWSAEVGASKPDSNM